jgi:N utilization substance protein B
VTLTGSAGEGPRHEARERALSLLYEAELKGIPASDVLAGLPVVPDPFAVALVQGVQSHLSRIDELVSGASAAWELGRMPVVDRAVLRMATYELLEEADVPLAVVIDEAVELVKRYSTDQSAAFVNGVLATISRQVRTSA